MSRIVAVVLALLVALPAVAGEIEDHEVRLVQLERGRAQVETTRQALESALALRATAIARLKTQPTSFARDRKLEGLLSESRDLAARVAQAQTILAAWDRSVAAERAALVAAIDRELPAARGARATALHARRVALAPLPRRLKIADESIDPLDDPEDLEVKADALARSEAQLVSEAERLTRRAGHYEQQARLEKSRRRADEIDVFHDGEQPARGGARATGPVSAGPASENRPTTGGTDGDPSAVPSDDWSEDGTGALNGGYDTPAEPAGADITLSPTVVLADVVGTGTLDDLRRAERSGDPAELARAARAARAEVLARAARVRAQREAMERRARDLKASE